MRTKLLLCALCLSFLAATAADEPIKREVRGAWLATVYCIDWPTTTGTGTSVRNEQKQELHKYIASLKAANLNAVYFQVRPMADALYRSSYEPWSSYVSGTRGRNPGWDPLQFAVDECHKVGMECHAWINPYRWATTEAGWDTPQDQELKENGMLISYTNGNGATTTILNPALKATRDRITAVCREIIQNYDVDGIIFDDYFYPSGMPTTSAAADYNDYKTSRSKLSFADWRRENVNQMVADVYNMIQEENPAIRFGISPAGAACTDASVAAKHGITKCPVASDWQYNGIFSDPVAWLKAGTIDYISPQLYWKTDHKTNPFEPLTKWWSYVAKHFNRHHYASHSLTFLQSSNTENDWVEVGEQLQHSRNHTENAAPGSIYYSACDIDGKKVSGLGNWLKKNKYQYPALPPAIDWKDTYPCNRVHNLTQGISQLTWDGYEGMRYTVYAIPDDVDNEQAFASNGNELLATYLVSTAYTNAYSIPSTYRKGYHFAVCVLDRYGNESAPRFSDEEELPAADVPQLVWPDDKATFRPDVRLIWVEGLADEYVVEVSRNKRFTNLLLTAQSGWDSKGGNLSLATATSLWKEGTYYWRVKARAAGCEETISEIRSFTISGNADIDGTSIHEMASVEGVAKMFMRGHTVSFSQKADIVVVQSLQGIVLAQYNDVRSVRLNGLPRGIYIVKAHIGNEILVNKIKL